MYPGREREGEGERGGGWGERETDRQTQRREMMIVSVRLAYVCRKIVAIFLGSKCSVVQISLSVTADLLTC